MPENCWEYWKCPKRNREKCKVFQLDMGSQCYNVSHDFRPQRKREFDDCFDCAWFRRTQPHVE